MQSLFSNEKSNHNNNKKVQQDGKMARWQVRAVIEGRNPQHLLRLSMHNGTFTLRVNLALAGNFLTNQQVCYGCKDQGNG